MDGNASSWDRYRLVGMFGGVPIRFETAWEECWHDALVEGDNWIRADRDTLPQVIARLRGDDEAARRIAHNASVLAATRLTPAAMEAFLGRVLTAATTESGGS